MYRFLKTIKYLSVLTLVVVVAYSVYYKFSTENKGISAKKLKLYWFIPDGVRAEPTTFNIYKWANEGLLPNVKKMMERGSYGFSEPVFPGHTPTNFATIFTGSYPQTHGVADGPMRSEGYPLEMIVKSGFSSVAKKVPPLWYTLENRGYSVSLLSIPGSTPPELSSGITIKGRWGGWGLDFPAINFHSANDKVLRKHQGPGNRVFYFGSELTKFISTYSPKGWLTNLPKSYSSPRELKIENWGSVLYAYIYDSNNDGIDKYESVVFSHNKRDIYCNLKEGEWSGWNPIKLSWEMKNDYKTNTPKKMDWEMGLSKISIDTEVKIKIIKLGEKDFFRIRFLYNGLNQYLTRPSYLFNDINESIGPMVDFVDNYPPQLIYYPEDKKTFIEESDMSLEWHKKAVNYLINKTESDVVIHDTYTPNQMLTSRWWMGYLDPKSSKYNDVDEKQRKILWNDVIKMYQKLDDILGKILKNADDDTYIIFSSDHGAVPLDKEVRLNNLFAKEGLLKFKMNNSTEEYEIDWKKTKVIYLKMDSIYINPKGLAGGSWQGSGVEFKILREKVVKLLKGLKDDNGVFPIGEITLKENAHYIQLPKDRVGDLILANTPGYGFIEEISSDLKIFKNSLKTGYKQAISPKGVEGMLTPFMIVGPGVKKGFRIPGNIMHVDQYPTIMKLLGEKIPSFVEGKSLQMIMTK